VRVAVVCRFLQLNGECGEGEYKKSNADESYELILS